MFLSRLILNPLSKQVQRELSRPYQMHRTILSAFPSEMADAERVLYRLDQEQQTNRLALLVQSKTQPDWSYLAPPKKDYLIPEDLLPEDWQNPAVKDVELDSLLRAGQILAFRLRANPTKRLGKSSGKDQGKRVGIYEPEKQIEWLKRKAEASGFKLIDVRTSQDGMLKDKIHRDNSDDILKLFGVQFDGVLEVLDPGKLGESILNGIGSGKGFGFGLLSLARR